MMLLVDGFIMSVTMFSIIPLPRRWNDRACHLIIPVFPVVGLIIGKLWYTFSLILMNVNSPTMLSTALLLFFPLIASGFIHIDGFMDTSDAIFSRAELAKKRAILKDSHVGAFAVIALVLYLFIGFSGIFEVVEQKEFTEIFIYIPILSRCIAGFTLLKVKLISETGFAATFRQNTKPIHCAIILACAATTVLIGFFSGGLHVLLPLVVLIASGSLAAKYVVKQLDGISGDLCGFIVVVSELCALVCFAVLIGGQK